MTEGQKLIAAGCQSGDEVLNTIRHSPVLGQWIRPLDLQLSEPQADRLATRKG